MNDVPPLNWRRVVAAKENSKSEDDSRLGEASNDLDDNVFEPIAFIIASYKPRSTQLRCRHFCRPQWPYSYRVAASPQWQLLSYFEVAGQPASTARTGSDYRSNCRRRRLTFRSRLEAQATDRATDCSRPTEPGTAQSLEQLLLHCH